MSDGEHGENVSKGDGGRAFASISITVVVDNHARSPSLCIEHGLSFWIETPTARVLFDTGAGAALMPNVAALGIPLETATAIVLSHGHADHSGGLEEACERAPRASIFAHRAVTQTRYSTRRGVTRAIGMPDGAKAALARRGLVMCNRPVRIASGVWATGAIPCDVSAAPTDPHLVLDGADTPDPIIDDQALLLELDGYVALVCGCCHSGLINTLAYAHKLSKRSVRAVLGGLHLFEADRDTLARVAGFLEQAGAPRLMPAHCTGQDAIEYLSARFGAAVSPLSVGDRLTLQGGSDDLAVTRT